MPPITAPMEEPASATMDRPRASIASITPMWARPRAPPEPSTSATRRRSAIGGEREPEQDLGFLAQRRRRHHLGVGPVAEHVHQQLLGIAVGQLELVAAVRQVPAFLARMPVLVGDPARGP